MYKDNITTIFDSASYSVKCDVIIKVAAVHKILKTSSDIAMAFFAAPNVKVYNFFEYCDIVLNYSPDDEEYETVSNKIKDTFKLENYRSTYNNHWFYITTEIHISNNSKEIILCFPDSYNPHFHFTTDNYPIIISASLKTSYVDVNGYQKPIDTFTAYVESLEFTNEEKAKISMLNRRQYTNNTQPQKKFSISNFAQPLFSKKEEKNNNISVNEGESGVFDASILSIADGMNNSDLALAQLIGLGNVKEEIEKFKAKLEYRRKQEKRGIYCEQNDSMHMCFLGAPGTGKTTVARIVTGILYDLGYIKSNKCVEVNGENLKGGYVGQTAIITKAVMRNARNKVLFIDEAYALFDNFENGYGKEAIAIILKEMEDNRDNMIVIFAGYDEEMQKFLKMNDGLKSRINRYIHFQNYSPLEMLEIMMTFLEKRKLYITEESMKICLEIFKDATFNPRFSNARFVRNLVEKIEEEHIYNVRGIKDIARRDTILPEDITDDIIRELLNKSM